MDIAPPAYAEELIWLPIAAVPAAGAGAGAGAGVAHILQGQGSPNDSDNAIANTAQPPVVAVVSLGCEESEMRVYLEAVFSTRMENGSSKEISGSANTILGLLEAEQFDLVSYQVPVNQPAELVRT
jgi:hypothetical protein